ncbi:uncharacterized protein LOC143149192 isoform X1 [Ptiloglossa arizonensis]|uniref:uncharacterized protein LOC143149192 isoform X1 n=1 Tax=Ptiloglossa arizonensis TaxID=3350558 RepID=UPI003FA05E0A
MARVFIYERPLDAILTDMTFYDKLNCPENGIKVKEEPSDPETHNHNDSSSVSNIGSVTGSKLTLGDNFPNLTNDKENERLLLKKHADSKSKKLVLNKKKRRCLEPRKLEGQKIQTMKKRRKYLRGCLNNEYHTDRKKSEFVECDVCLLPFTNKTNMKCHKILYDTGSKCICDICNAIFSSISMLVRHKKACPRSQPPVSPRSNRYICNFCQRTFSSKRPLQAHLLHIHENLKFISEIEADKTQKNILIENTNHHVVNADVNKVGEVVLNGNNNNHIENADITERLNSLSSSPGKKLRQTTLVEFLPFFNGKQKEELVNSEKVSCTDQTTIIPRQDRTQEINYFCERKVVNMQAETVHVMSTEIDSSTDKVPFVEEHMDSNMMADSLKDKIKVESENAYSSTTSSNIVNDCRQIVRRDANRPSVALDSILPSKPINEGNSVITRKRKRENALLFEEELKLKFKCKECVICLERCDEILNGSNFRIQESECTFLQISSIKMEDFENDQPMSPSHLTVDAPQSPVVIVNDLIKIEDNESLTYQEELPGINDRIEINEKEFQCKICKKSFSSRENMHEHIELLHVVYMSSICKARYTSRNKLLSHYLCQHTISKRKQCCVCHVKFNTSVMLKQHMILHCTKNIRSKSDDLLIDREIRCNAIRKRHQCKFCDKRFYLKSCLIQHQKLCRRINENTKKQEKESRMKTSFPLSKQHKKGIATLNVSDTQNDSNFPIQYPANKHSSIIDGIESTINSTLRASKATSLQSRIVPSQKRLINNIVCVKNYQTDLTGIEKVKFPCIICNKQFQTFQNLCMHERTFCKPANNKCTVCGTLFTTKRLLQLHMLATHAPMCSLDYKYFCKFCNQGFSKKANIQVHERHFHSDQTVMTSKSCQSDEYTRNINTVCTVCNLSFESHECFIEHNKYYYKGQVFTCTFCNQVFQGMYMLYHHKKLVHYPKITHNSYTYVCDICSEGFNKELHFYAHKLHFHSHEASSTSGDQKYEQDHNYALTTNNIDTQMKIPLMAYTCDICTLYFTNKMDLQMHEIEYSLNGNFKCNKCDKKCRTAAILIKHQSLNHNGCDTSNCYKCRFCGEVLTTSTSMVCHEKHFHGSNSALESSHNISDQLNADQESNSKDAEKSDSRRDNITCLTCNMKFEDEMKLKDHLLEYSDIGGYSCSICHRKFMELYRLEVHKLKHTKLNFILSDHHCPICHEGFPNSTNVQMHILHLHRYETFPRIVTKQPNNMRGNKNPVGMFENIEIAPVKLSNAFILSSTDQEPQEIRA